ncbi:hypothetical protein [Mycobacterium sp. SMC-8]|uniref:hypothetical protein n=1 Tax=Mycobacterium sp. SMC-8 TaxID=2857060 RepID=UPI0021B4BE18|nr:hypothetical protein [Mycobacterium sp. SMC-8]
MSRGPARLRGAAAGLLTAALTLAAHSAGGGLLPVGASAVQLVLVAAVVAAVTSAVPRTDRLPVLVGVLGAGQVIGHAVLSVHGHPHSAPPASAMAAAHILAVVVGAVLIEMAARLCLALSTVLRIFRSRGVAAPAAATTTAVRTVDHPLRSTLLLAFSMSHRGPPVTAHR